MKNSRILQIQAIREIQENFSLTREIQQYQEIQQI